MVTEQNKNKHKQSFLSVNNVSDVCNVSEKTVRRWIDNGELVAHRLGNRIRISPNDFDIFLKLRREG